MKSDRVRALDGLRAFAVLAVVLEHSITEGPHENGWALKLWHLGPSGVRLFFVLSGFLITGILLNARTEAEERSSGMGQIVRNFYARRALRIFPLAYTAMLIAWLIGLPVMREFAVWYLTYTSNIGIFLGGVEGIGGIIGLGHFWSLAIEEQFYLFWPALILFAPRRHLRALLWSTVAIAVITRIAVVAYFQHPFAFDLVYILTPSRLDALAFGGVIAVDTFRVRQLVVAAVLLACAGLLLPVGAVWAGVNELAGVISSAALVLAATRGFGRTVLSWRTFVYLGTISYGMYVWHFLLPSVLGYFGLSLASGMPAFTEGWRTRAVLPSLAWTIAIASLSWFALERPLNSLKRYFPYAERGPGNASGAQPLRDAREPLTL